MPDQTSEQLAAAEAHGAELTTSLAERDAKLESLEATVAERGTAETQKTMTTHLCIG